LIKEQYQVFHFEWLGKLFPHFLIRQRKGSKESGEYVTDSASR